MKAELVCPIPVHRIAVFAEMAWLERRPELGVLCRSAQDNHNQISVPIVQAVVPSIETSGAHNVIAWCRMLGLCDAGGVLTSLGQDVAQKSEAPVPEQGVFGLWLAQHPLLGRRILSADRMARPKMHVSMTSRIFRLSSSTIECSRRCCARKIDSFCASCQRTTDRMAASRDRPARRVGFCGRSILQTTTTVGGSKARWI